jgi:hypothetical protein
MSSIDFPKIDQKLTVPQLAKNFPEFLGTQKVRYPFHNSPPIVSILSQMNPVHTMPCGGAVG